MVDQHEALAVTTGLTDTVNFVRPNGFKPSTLKCARAIRVNSTQSHYTCMKANLYCHDISFNSKIEH